MKNVLITGVSRGIGRALAERFLSAGDEVVGTYLRSVPEFAGERLTLFPLDLADPKSIKECAVNVEKSGKKIDVLINNAGALFDEDETTVVVDKLRKTLEVNLIGPIDFTGQVLPHINSGGHIINISSTAGSLALAHEGKSHFPDHYPAYRISKTALNMFTVTLSRVLHKNNITVSSVHPGWVKTEMGGQEADLTPEQAAEDIYNFSLTKPSTGLFWFKGEPLPW